MLSDYCTKMPKLICLWLLNPGASRHTHARTHRTHAHTHTHILCLKDFGRPIAYRKYNLLIGECRGADKSLARPTSRCIVFDAENISFDASLVYINSTNIPPIVIINGIYETQNLLSLWLVSFLVGPRTYQHPCILQKGT